jgi:hypothetical protein
MCEVIEGSGALKCWPEWKTTVQLEQACSKIGSEKQIRQLHLTFITATWNIRKICNTRITEDQDRLMYELQNNFFGPYAILRDVSL